MKRNIFVSLLEKRMYQEASYSMNMARGSLSFPVIYLGYFRNFREEVRITPSMMATSELRRVDSLPTAFAYMAMKIMRLSVLDSLTVAFKHVGENTNITQQIESKEYNNCCIENNLAFLRAIPNSTWYWSERKRDLLNVILHLQPTSPKKFHFYCVVFHTPFFP
ncbi:serine--tRNA ligase [Trichonephila clavipes]|nr:serine--tRNA ligase [Trichonephila clavipes]